MIQTGFESRVKVQDLINSQLPSFILDESPNAVEFLKQYYISQEYQGGPIDLADNLDQYLKLDNLTPEVVVDSTTLSADITSTDSVISVSSTKGFPDRYGILKIDDEIITYTEKTTTSFTGCIRGFSGITNYHQELKKNELVFEETVASDHTANTTIQNLSSLFLKEFYKKLKKHGLVRWRVNQIWNKAGGFALSSIFEYKDQKAFEKSIEEIKKFQKEHENYFNKINMKRTSSRSINMLDFHY